MPILAKSSSGTVTGLWGSAFVRLPSGKLKPLAVGDEVKKGEHIVTTQDGLVQISPPKGGKPVEVKPNLGKPAHTELAGHSDIDKTIAALERGDQDAATAAGLDGGASGGLLPGLRVDRVVELVTPLEFQYETARTPVGIPIPAGLYFAEAPQGSPTPVVPVDDRATVSGVSSASTVEGGALVFKVALSSDLTKVTPVTLKLVDDTASTKSDIDLSNVKFSVDGGKTFQAAKVGADGSFTVDVPAGAGKDALVVQVNSVSDAVLELDESFKLVASTSKDLETGASKAGLGTIEEPGIVSEVSSATTTEGGTLEFKVALSGGASTVTPVTLKLVDGSATTQSDIDLNDVKVSVDGGKTFQTVKVSADGSFTVDVPPGAGKDALVVQVASVSDGTLEPDESFKLVAATAKDVEVGASKSGVGTIEDLPQVSFENDVSGVEGGDAVFSIILSKPSKTDVIVNLHSENGSAGDDDYGSFSGLFIVIPAGDTRYELPVKLFIDDLKDDAEKFTLKIDSVETSNATIGTDSAEATILMGCHL